MQGRLHSSAPRAPRSPVARWSAFGLALTLAGAGCPATPPARPVVDEEPAKARPTPRGRRVASRPADAAAQPPASLPVGKPWTRCDGALSVEDIPNTPLTAVVAGKRLAPTARAARASAIGRALRLDFAQTPRWDPARPCFFAESPLAASLEHRDQRYARGFNLAAGRYRLGGGWRAAYSFQDASGRRVERRPAYYGLLVIESATGLDRKPARMFEPTGRVRGKLAICFKDAQRSWIAGSFDVPACGDTP